jgi:ABC-type proline/glycine betaine transport system ATPase subunit
MTVKIRLDEVVKIFGKRPDSEAPDMLRSGVAKDEGVERTGNMVGGGGHARRPRGRDRSSS